MSRQRRHRTRASKERQQRVMPLAATPNGSGGSGATTLAPSPSAAAGDGEEASNGQGRTGDDGGVQATGAQGREGALDAETLVGEFPEWNWGEAVQLRARLPLLLFLKHCDRGNATTSGDACAMLHRVKVWLQGHERFKTLRFESSPERIFSYLFTIAKNKLLADMFGVRHRQEEEKDVFDLVVYPWRACVANVFASVPLGWTVMCDEEEGLLFSTISKGAIVPLGWTVMCDEEEGLLFSTISKGANVKVGIRKADISGRSEVSFVTFNGRNVKDEHAQDWPSHIDSGNRNQRQRGKLLEKVGSLQPCVGTSREHLDGNAARGFLSVVHTAEISLEKKRGVFSEGDLGWASAMVKGCLETSGRVSGILGWVGGRRVFWSKECTGVAASGDGGLDDRCSPCRGFHRDVFLGLATAGAGEDPLLGGAAGGGGSSATEGPTEPEPEPQAQPASEKERAATPNLLEQQIKNARCQCFVAEYDVQGQALLDFLLYSGTRDVFLKYPEGSLPRALYEALVRWNTTRYPPPKVFVFHPEILRLACCAPGFAGSNVYDALREVLHLPSMARVVQLRRGIRGATGLGSGMQMVEIKRYAQMAATEGVDNADLVGVVTWDLVRLNRNGFRANPNGTGISGLVDANSFFNPECGAPPLDGGGSVHGDDCEGILDRVYTTRYMEARFVSAGNPKYNFIAYRGAVVSLNADYIQRMLTTVLRALASPHEDVVFDVIAAVCGGDLENMVCSRYFQLHGGTETFEDRDGDADYDYSGLSVAFRHPHHLHEVFNMTDPARVVQKVVEALVESENPQRERSLGMYRTDWNTGRSEFREFSSKTAQNLRSYGAELAASADTAVPAVPVAAAAVGGTTGASRRPAPAAATATAAAVAPVGGSTGASERLASVATATTAAGAASVGDTTPAPERLASSATTAAAAAPVSGTASGSERLASASATAATAAPVSGTTGASEILASVATTATAASLGGTTGTSEMRGSDATTATAAAAASVDGTTGESERLAPAAATAAAADAATPATTAPVGSNTGASERLGTVATSTTAAAAASVSGTTGAPDRVTSAATTTSAAAATTAALVGGTPVAPERLTSGATTVTATATAAVGVSTAAPERLASAATTAAAAPVRGTASVSEWIASIAAEAAAAAATAAPVGGTAGASERLGSAAAIADAAAATAAIPVSGTTAATAAPVGGTAVGSEKLGSAAATAIADATAATVAVPVTGATAATTAPVDGTSGASETLGSATATAIAAAAAAVPVTGTTAATAAPVGGTAGTSERLGSAAATAVADADAAAATTAAAPVTGTTGASERLASTPRLPMPARGVCHARVKGPRQFAQQMVSRTVIRTVQSQRETLGERLGCLENFEKMASHLRDLIDIFNGNYGRSDSERRQGVNKIKGYVTSSDSVLTRRLMEILDFFSNWEYELASSPPHDTTNWQRHFISQASWFDLRMCILGFVSLCRYVFPGGAAGGAAGGDADRREGASRARRRYVNPRTFSQGFAHLDDGGPGTHGPRNQEIERFKRSKYGEGTHRILTQRQQTFLTSKLGNLNRTPGAMPRVAAERRSRNAARRESGSGPGVAASSVAQ